MKKSKFITDFKDIPTPRQEIPHLPLGERRGSFQEVELGFDEERAVREAKRCLSCRRCIGCGLCLAECDPRAVVYDDKGRTVNLKVGTIVLAPGLDEFDAGRMRELGYRKFPNIITSTELERMLSPTGPYGGIVLRPYDGQIPSTVAFIQCVGSRDEALGADYCSSICCMSAMKEAISLVKQTGDVQVKILHRDIRPLGKGSEEFYQSVLKEKQIGLTPAVVTKIDEISENKNLVVEFSSDGAKKEEEFELVVLSVGVRPSSTTRALSRKTRIKLNKYGFCLTDLLNPTLTSKDGIVAAGVFAGPIDIQESVCQAGAAASVALRNLGIQSALPARVGPSRDSTKDVISPDTGRHTVSGAAGILICKYGLSSCSTADAEELLEQLRTTPGVSFVETSDFLCVELSRRDFRNAVAKAGISSVLVVPCYEPTYEPLFVNTFSESGEGHTGVTVLDLLSLSGTDRQSRNTSFVKERVVELIRSIKEDKRAASRATAQNEITSASVLVIGSGLAGLTAALELSHLGHEVTVIEKGEEPGGVLSGFPLVPEGESDKNVVSSLLEAIEATGKTRSLFCTELASFSGELGRFSTVLRSNGGEKSESFGAVIVCAGAEEYVPEEFLHGKEKRVVTQLEFEEILRSGEFEASSVAMIQCVGSRSSEWPVCSRICCAQALRNALRLKQLNPEARVTVLHRDIRVYSLEEELLSEALEKEVELVRVKHSPSEPAPGIAVELSGGEKLCLAFQKETSRATETILVDYAVLSTGFRPRADTRELAKILGVKIDDKGFFTEIHSKLRPVESSKKGIYICGLAHSPQTASETISQAMAAAKKASSALKSFAGKPAC